MAVVAQSVGAVLVSTWAHDYAPKVRALVLASPAFQVKLYVPFARSGLKLMRLWLRQFLRQQLCQGTLPQSRPAADRLLRQRPADRQGDLGERPARPLRSCRAGGSRRTGDPDSHPTADFRGRLRRPSCAAGALLRASRQPAQGKAHPARLLPRHPWRGAIVTWPSAVPGASSSRHSPRHLNDRACSMPTVWAIPAPRPRRWPRRCRRTRRAISTGAPPVPGCAWAACGRTGVKLGFDTGFDSGSTLDYVYRNQPSGSGPLGRLIDRNYLDSIGWRGIRQRKLHAESCCAWPCSGCARSSARCASSTSPPATAATSSKPCKASSRCRKASSCATTARSTCVTAAP